MHILKVSQTYYPYLSKGGPPAAVRGIARTLARRGHHVTVLTAHLGESDIVENGLNARCRPESNRAGEQDVEAIYLPTVLRYRTVTLNPQVVTFCTRRLREFDVVHIYGMYDLMGPVVAWFCRRWNVPYFVEPIGMLRPIVRNIIPKHVYNAVFGRRMVQQAVRVIATSELERGEFLEEGLPLEKIVLRRNGLDLREFDDLPPRGGLRATLGIGREEPLILFLGRISFIKGPDLLVQAFSRIDGDAKLIIAGPDDGDGCLDKIQKLTVRLGLGERVRMIGPIYGERKLQALADADIFVQPSLHESFSIAATEAIVCGVPVIVTDQCGIAPLVQDRVGLVVPCDVEAISDAMDRLLANPSLRERFRANTYQLRRDLSWEEPVSRMEEVYDRIAGGR